jgi:Trk K+ transport system NAD-binding subunit
LGERVAVVTTETPRDWPLPGGEGFALFLGDARDDKLLRQANITAATAIILTTNDDLTNVSIALEARQLNPKIRVVVRLFDQQLGAHLEKGAGIHRALSTSALAAPAFVGAALGDTARGSFETREGVCVIEDRTVKADSPEMGRPLGEWSSASGWSVVGLCRGGLWQVENLGPIVLQAGDVLAVLRVVPSAGAAGPTPAQRSRASSWRTLGLGLRGWWHDVPRALRIALGILFLVVLTSVALFHWKLNLPFVDALYFVITIITTVGFGDYNFLNAPPALKLYGALLMLCGAALLALLFSIITDLVLSTRFRDLLARGCSQLEGHIIVVGLGNLGYRVLRELTRSGQMVVAIEREAGGKFVEAARSRAPVVLGNGRAEETLQKAGLAGAKAVLAVTDDDIANLSIGLAAKRARPEIGSVLRVFDARLAEKLRVSLGAHVVLSVSAEAAPTFVAAALGPHVLHGFLLGAWLVAIFQCPAAGPTPAAAARNELALSSGGIGLRWRHLLQEG